MQLLKLTFSVIPKINNFKISNFLITAPPYFLCFPADEMEKSARLYQQRTPTVSATYSQERQAHSSPSSKGARLLNRVIQQKQRRSTMTENDYSGVNFRDFLFRKRNLYNYRKNDILRKFFEILKFLGIFF